MTTSRRGELARKLLHLALSLAAAAIVWSLPPTAAATVLAAAAFVALTVELARRTSARFRMAFQALLSPMLRDHEATRLTGATTLAVGYTVAAVLLPGVPAAFGILVAGLADPTAALAGRRWGRYRYRGGKSIEGSAAFLVVTLVIALMLPGVGPGAALALAVALTAIEAPTLRLDDNLYLAPVAASLLALLG